MHLFHKARQQLVAAMSAPDSRARVVQLGDLGGYDHRPGQSCSSSSNCGGSARTKRKQASAPGCGCVLVDTAVGENCSGLTEALLLLSSCRLPRLLCSCLRLPDRLWCACGPHHRQPWWDPSSATAAGSTPQLQSHGRHALCRQKHTAFPTCSAAVARRSAAHTHHNKHTLAPDLRFSHSSTHSLTHSLCVFLAPHRARPGGG